MKITDIDRRIADLVAINPRPTQPSALVEMGRGILARDVDAATKCFDKAISIDPRYVPAWIARSEALCLLGRKGQAVGCLERAIDVDPKNAELTERRSKILAELAAASSRNRRFDPPSSQSPVAAKAPPPSSSRLIAREEVTAREIVDEKEAPPPPPPPPSQPRPPSLPPAPPPSEPKASEPKASAPQASEPKLETAPASPRTSDDPLEDALHLLASGRHIEALRKIEPLSKQPDASADVWLVRGEICAALDQREAEIASYEKATKIEPKNVRAWLGLAKARVAMKRLERGLDAADQALLIAPFDGTVQKLRGTILMALAQGTAAVSAFEKATQHAPDDAEAWLELGRALRAVRRPDAARDALRRALAIAETMDPRLVPAVREQLERLK